MPRYFVLISEDELRDKIDKALEKNCTEDILHLGGKVAKDLSKVDFDCENLTDEKYKFGPADGLIGFHTLPNGLTFYGASANGDWQIPVFFIIYYDGKNLRGYIPELGNPWNTDNHKAYGEDLESDLKNARKRFGNHITEDDMEDLEIPKAEELICLDIGQRFVKKK